MQITEDEGFLYVAKYVGWENRSRQVYGCRGFGVEYNQFWKDFDYNKCYEHDDWPWSYFALPPEDEARFLRTYGDIIVIHDEVHDKDDDA